MPEIPDDAWDDWYEDRRRKLYQSELARHPHPSDPDHPDPEDYGIEDDEDEQ